MKKLSFLALLGGVLAAMPYTSIAGLIEGGTIWFNENAESFDVNSGEAWGYSEGSAWRNGSRINIDASVDFGEVNYLPTVECRGFRVVVENTMSFSYASGMPYNDTDDVAAISVVEDVVNGGCVFAVLDPTDGWFQTTTPAELKHDYVIKVDIDYSDAVRKITYSYKPSIDGGYVQIAQVSLPASAPLPSEFAFSGAGSLTTMDAEFKEDKTGPENEWGYATAVVDWRSAGGASTAVDMNSSNAKFTVASKNEQNEWVEGASYFGASTYTEFPGYGPSTAVPFYNAFVKGAAGYKAPGMVLRFTDAAGTYAGKVGGAFADQAFAGILVEPGATGYSLVQSGTGRTTSLGDPNGERTARFEINEDFAVNRSGAVTIYGKNQFVIAKNKTFDLNSKVTGTTGVTTLDCVHPGTSLEFVGEGQLAVSTMFATGNVAFVFSQQSIDRIDALVKGKLTVGDGTFYEFPAGYPENKQFPLVEGSLTAQVTARKTIIKEIRVGTETFFAKVTLNTSMTPARTVKYEMDTSSLSTAVYVRPGATFTVNGSDNPAAPVKFTGTVISDGTVLVKGFVNFSHTSGVNGSGEIVYDLSEFELEGDKVQIGNITKVASTSLKFGVAGIAGWAITVEGKNVYAVRRDYSKWENNSALFEAKEHKLVQIDPISGASTGMEFKYDQVSGEVPGWEGSPVTPWQLFSAAGKYKAPGYALKFTEEYPGIVDFTIADLALGGVVVEPGVTGVVFKASASGSTTRFGDTDGIEEDYFEFGGDFTIERNGAVSIVGSTVFDVAGGKTFDLNSKYTSAALKVNAGAKLAMKGAGTMKVATLDATGACTLDFGALDKARTAPFITGNLKVDADTEFRFPADVTSYKLCSGTLTAPATSPAKLICVGERAFYADLTFNTTTKTVSWTEMAVNHATISADCNWTAITWDSGAYNWSLPAVLTLTKNARILFSTTLAGTIKGLTIEGGYRARLAYQKTPTITRISVSGGSSYDISLPTTTDFKSATAANTVPAGETYVIEGYSGTTVRTWAGDWTIEGTLKTSSTGTGAIKLTGEDSKTVGAGKFVVESGKATVTSTMNNTEVHGTLAMDSVTWHLNGSSTLNIGVGGTVSGTGVSSEALMFTGGARIGFISPNGTSGTATLSANCNFDASVGEVEYDVADGMTATISSSVMSAANTGAKLIKSGAGELIYGRSALVPEGGLIVKNGVFSFKSGTFNLNYTNDGIIRVMSSVTLTTDAATAGRVEVLTGGRLILRIKQEDADYGYVATGVTLPSGNNVIFELPDGTQRTGDGNILSGTGAMWTDATGNHKWSDAGNWSSLSVPAVDTLVSFPTEATVDIPTAALAKEILIRAPVKFSNTTISTVTADRIRCTAGGSIVKEGKGELAFNAQVGSSDEPFAGNITVNAGSISFNRTGTWVTGNVSGTGAVIVGYSVEAALLGKNTYTGATTVNSGGTLAVMGDLGETGSLIGPEDAAIQFNGLTIDKKFTVSRKVAASKNWEGYIWLKNCELVNADLSVFEPLSRIKMTSVRGSFLRGGSYAGTVIVADEDGKMALDVTGGLSGRHYTIGALEGDGTVGSSDTIAGFQLAFVNTENFEGSINIAGDKNMFGLYFTDKADNAHQGGFYIQGDRTYKVPAGARLYSSGAIGTDSNGVIYVQGAIGGRFKGYGRVDLEPACEFISPVGGMVGDDWYGTVKLVGWTVKDTTHLESFGGPNSKVGFERCEGFLMKGSYAWDMELYESDTGLPALKITQGFDDCEVRIAKISGKGTLNLSLPKAGGMNGQQYWRVMDITDLKGGITIEDGVKASVIFGDREPSGLENCFDFSEGFLVPAVGKSVANNVTFDKSINVIGKANDVIMKVMGRLTGDFEDIMVYPSEISSRVLYRLHLDGDSRELKVVLKSAPPEMNIDDVRLVYGSDLTNATVKVTVSDYWGGVNYLGGAWALVVVKDSEGTVIGAVGGKIDSNGTFDLGPLMLFGGGRDYYYEVRLEAYESDISDPVEILNEVTVDQSAHPAIGSTGDWIHENATTYASTVIAEKTGVWTDAEFSASSVKDGEIRVEAGSVPDEAVHFTAYRTLTNDIVEVDIAMRPDGGFDDGTVVPGPNAKAALIFLNDDEAKMDFGGLNPETGKFERLFVADIVGRPQQGRVYNGRVAFNYREGTVAYSIEGTALTNSEGRSYFKMSDEFKAKRESIRKAHFVGNGNVVAIAGRDRDATLVTLGGVKYDDMDEAVDAAQESGETVKLMWDATWRPSLDDIGKNVKFDENGHVFTIDGKAVAAIEKDGYRLVKNPDGSYTVDLVTFKITFTKNHDDWANEDTDYFQEFTATNAVLKLIENRFDRVHFDFDHWNTSADDEDPDGTVWHDCEEVNMAEFGFTNITLHAQWKVASRRVIIEPADPHVYIESVMTNGVAHTAITFFGEGAATGARSAMFDAEDGADLVVNFTTDLEYQLIPYYYIRRQPAETDHTIVYADLPKIYDPNARPVLTPLEEWAYSKGISKSALENALKEDPSYTDASMNLDTDYLLSKTSKFEITDFALNGTVCTFKVLLDGEIVSDREAIRSVIYVTESLTEEWQHPDVANLSVDPVTGMVTLTTESKSTFIRIVIPSDIKDIKD